MVIPIIGNVTYAITLDPSVWIFDDRKVIFKDAFSKNKEKMIKNPIDAIKKTSKLWDQEVNQQKIRPPVNKSISRFEREKILINTYVMPIKEFVSHAEIKDDAKSVTIVTNNEDITITIKKLQECYLLFAENGKPLKDGGPVHLYFSDSSNKDCPITNIKKFIVN